MGKLPTLVGSMDGPNPYTGLRAVAALRRLLRVVEELQVDGARARGWSWQEIADALGANRRATRRRHGGRRDPQHRGRQHRGRLGWRRGIRGSGEA
jgi:SRSO17 transposase